MESKETAPLAPIHHWSNAAFAVQVIHPTNLLACRPSSQAGIACITAYQVDGQVRQESRDARADRSADISDRWRRLPFGALMRAMGTAVRLQFQERATALHTLLGSAATLP